MRLDLNGNIRKVKYDNLQKENHRQNEKLLNTYGYGSYEPDDTLDIVVK